MKPTLVVLESIFCDYEFDPQIRQRFLQPWLASIAQLSKLRVPLNSTAMFILYLSEDKEMEINAVRDLISGFPEDIRDLFKVVTYSHPPEGYGYEDAKHPDLIKNPNKVAPQRDRLFDKALSNVDVHAYERIIRLALDDDDFLLEWQLDEIVRAADLAYTPDEIIAVGMPNQVVSYIEPKRADVVSMTHQLNGTKFYVSSTNLFQKQRRLSPWSIPEYFNDKNISRMARAGVRLVTVQDNVPGLIYCRWGHNLSLHDKSGYYTNLFEYIEFSSVESMVSTLEGKLPSSADAFRKHPRPVIFHDPTAVTANKVPARSASKYRIWAPEKSDHKKGRIVAVFRSPSGITVSSNITHSGSRLVGVIPALKDVEFDYVGYLQYRGSDNSRKQISARARLRFVDQITKFSLGEILESAENLPESRLRTFENCIGMLLWMDSPKSRAYLLELVDSIAQSDAIASPDSLLKYAFDESRKAPNKFTSSAFSCLWNFQVLKQNSGTDAFASRSLESVKSHSSTENQQTEKFPSLWASFNRVWNSVEHFCESFELSNSEGNQRITTPAYPIDIQLDSKKSKPLVVFLHGRKSPEVKLPYLSGAGLAADLDISRLSISDPSHYIDPGLSIAWFTGSSTQPELQANIVNIVKKVAKELEAPKVIFVGGSAGGFASMVFSHQIENSVALVWNPQTDVFRYHKNFVNSYVAHCWPDGTNSIPDTVVTSVVKRYEAQPSQNLVLYMQEETDSHHIDEHFKPFQDALSPDSRILTYQSHWGDGHAPAPKPLLKQILLACISENFEASVKQIGFRPL